MYLSFLALLIYPEHNQHFKFLISACLVLVLMWYLGHSCDVWDINSYRMVELWFLLDLERASINHDIEENRDWRDFWLNKIYSLVRNLSGTILSSNGNDQVNVWRRLGEMLSVLGRLKSRHSWPDRGKRSLSSKRFWSRSAGTGSWPWGSPRVKQSSSVTRPRLTWRSGGTGLLGGV